MNSSQNVLYSTTGSPCDKNKDGSKMFDPTTLVLIGTGSSSLFIAFAEYVYERKKRAETEAA
jgi:hypothetical protein